MNFDEICKFCNYQMELIEHHEHPHSSSGGETYIYWCPYCGAILDWYDTKPIQDDDWKEPIMTKDCI